MRDRRPPSWPGSADDTLASFLPGPDENRGDDVIDDESFEALMTYALDVSVALCSILPGGSKIGYY